MSFAGFSEDDIRKLTKNDNNRIQQKGSQNKTVGKKVTFKSNNIVNHVTKTSSKSISNNNNSINKTLTQEIPEEAKLSVTQKPKKVESEVQKTEDVCIQKSEEKISETANSQNLVLKQEKKYKDLDEFEARQKLIEEQNRKRKELLAKALADRTKQTQEEAEKLREIQDEFKRLDNILSSDVKILRKQIELASIDYMECQKRYHKIEKEFLEAKFLLHQKQEKKEMLTEHLCAIIEKNEERKAEKLNELIEKLQKASPRNSSNAVDQNKDISVVENK